MALARVCVLLALVAALAPTRAWEYAEHHILGDAAFKTFLDRFPDAKRHLSADGAANNFKLPKLGATVSFGRMVGLWADIYGNPDKPIIAGTDPQAEFESQFDASISGSGSGGVGVGDTKSEWSLVEAAADFELSGVRSRGAAFYESLDNQQSVCNLAFATASPPGTCPKIGGTADYAKNIISAIEKKSRFMALADVNFDHFGFYQTLVRLPAGAVKMPNRVVYVAAHTAACKRIMDATTPEQVDEAVLMEAAALHYLSDMFASGHLRTPRKELYDACETKKAGNLLAKCVHDEDNHEGLSVRNALGKVWKAYGDGRSEHTYNSVNKGVTIEAMVMSLGQLLRCREKASPPPAAPTPPPTGERKEFDDEKFGKIMAVVSKNAVELSWEKMPAEDDTGNFKTIVNHKVGAATRPTSAIVKGKQHAIKNLPACTEIKIELEQKPHKSQEMVVKTLGCPSTLVEVDARVPSEAEENDPLFGKVSASATETTAKVEWEKMPHMSADNKFSTIVVIKTKKGTENKIVKEPAKEREVTGLAKCTRVEFVLKQSEKKSKPVVVWTTGCPEGFTDEPPKPPTPPTTQQAGGPVLTTKAEFESLNNPVLNVVPLMISSEGANHDPMFDVRAVPPPQSLIDKINPLKPAAINQRRIAVRDPMEDINSKKFKAFESSDCLPMAVQCMTKFKDSARGAMLDVYDKLPPSLR